MAFTTASPWTIGDSTTKTKLDVTHANTVALKDEALTLAGVKTFSSKPVFSAGVTGVTDGSSAAAGVVGEVISAQRTFANRLSLAVSSTWYNLATLALPAGDWEISGNVWFLGAAGTIVTRYDSGASATSSGAPGTDAYGGPNASGEFRHQSLFLGFAGQQFSDSIPAYQYSGGATTLYLVAAAVWTVAAPEANGFLQARRIR